MTSYIYQSAEDQDETENMRRLTQKWGSHPKELTEQLEYELADLLEHEFENLIDQMPNKPDLDFHGLHSCYPGGVSFKLDDGDIISLIPTWKAILSKPLTGEHCAILPLCAQRHCLPQTDSIGLDQKPLASTAPKTIPLCSKFSKNETKKHRKRKRSKKL